jgi:cytochrome b561
MNSNRRSLLTKILHDSLLLSVLWQLIASGLVERPRDGQAGNLFYEVHKVVGLTTLGLVLAFWLWNVVRSRETPFAMLFPWFSSHRLTVVMEDLRAHLAQLRRFRLPAAEPDTPLASAVHGLGLLTVLAMATTGAWLYTQSVPGGLMLEAHEVISNLMWAYVVGHAGLALLHQVAGHAVLQRMFGNRADA